MAALLEVSLAAFLADRARDFLRVKLDEGPALLTHQALVTAMAADSFVR